MGGWRFKKMRPLRKRGAVTGLGPVLAMLFLAGCWAFPPAAAGAEAPEPVTLQLKWHHQFQFAGYYAAREKGYYREAGLSVELVEGGPFNTYESVLSGRAQYGVSNAEILLRRLKGDPVTVLAVIFQHSPQAFLVRKHAGIDSPHDLAGKRVWMTMESRSAELQAILLNEGVPLAAVEMVGDAAASYDDFLYDDRLAAVGVYVTNEPFYLLQRSIPVSFILPRIYGVDFYGDCLYTSETELADHPDRVRRFRAASLRGWEYAMAHPDEIISLIRDVYGAEKSADHLRFEAEKMRELILPQLVRIGHMNPNRWRHIADTYVQVGLADPDYSLEGFLYDPHPEPDYTWAYWTAGIAGGLLLVNGVAALGLMLFNRRLRSVVRRRTLELATQNDALTAEIEAKEKMEADVRFQARLLDAVGQAVIATDPEGTVLYVNKAAEILYGWPPGEMMGRSIFDATTPRTTREQAADIMARIKRGETWEGEFTVCRRDGTAFPAFVTNTPVFDETGALRAIIGISTDISEQRRAADDLRASEERFRRQFAFSPVPTFIYRHDGARFALMDYNRAVETLTRGTAANFMGMRADELYPDRPDLIEKFEGCVGREDPVVYETPYRARGTGLDRHILFTFVWVPPDLVMLHVEDITERRQMEADIAASLAEKEVLLREVHHRVKNNLMVVNSLVEMQAEGTADPTALSLFRDLRNRILAMTMVHETLYDSENLAEIEFGAYLERLVIGIRQGFSSGHAAVAVDVAADGIRLDIEKAIPCGLIAAELVTNAFKYAFPEPPSEAGEPPELRVEMRRENDMDTDKDVYALTVADNGAGLPPGFDIRCADTLGMELVLSWAEHQLGGTLDVAGPPGTAFLVRFNL